MSDFRLGSEAEARLDRGIQLLRSGRLEAATEQLTRSSDLFAKIGRPDQAAHAMFYAGGAQHLAGEHQTSLVSFAAAEAYLNEVAARDGQLSDDLSELLLRVEASWLESLCELAKDRSPDDAIVTEAVQRCDRVLASTKSPTGPLAVHARSIACFDRARLLARRGDYIAALPSAREAAEAAAGGRGPEARSRDRYMRMIMAEALVQLEETTDAANQFVRAAALAIPDDDTLTIDGALLGLSLLNRRPQKRLPIGLRELPAALAAAGARSSEARCRAVLARAMEMMPADPDTGRSLDNAEEYLRAARLFHELGEVDQEADALYAAGHLLSAIAWLHPEHRERSLALLIDAERLFRQVANWHGVGVTLFGQATLLNDSHAGVERDDARVAVLMQLAVEAFREAGRPTEEAGAMLMQARLAGLHSGSTERFVDLCCAAFSAYERGRASLLLPTEREYDDQRTSYTVSFLGSDVWDFLRANPTHPRRGDLVWGLEQLVKGRSFQDQQAAPTVWHRFLTKDAQLRELTEHLEQAHHSLEAALRRHDGESADAARSAVERIRRLQRVRLEDIAANSGTELELTSVPAVAWQAVQQSMAPREMYVGLTMSGREGRFLRNQLTSTDARFDAVDAPGLLALLIRQRNGEQLAPADITLLYRRAYGLLGLPASGVDTLVLCPDRHLVTVPWHLLDEQDTRPPLGDRVSIGVVAAAGAWARWTGAVTSPGATPEGLSYLGVSDRSTNLRYVDLEIENVRDNYFPGSGRCLPTGHSHQLLAERGHVSLLHIASHALAVGFELAGRTVTPIDLAGLELTADILLLTGCHLGAFGDDENNEFFGVVRQLLIATAARAAVVSLAPVPDAAGPLFAELVVSAMTRQARNRPWPLPEAALNVGDAVRWARLQMRELTHRDARRLRQDASRPDRGAAISGTNTLDPSWWASWFVVGDPKARLARRPRP